MTPKEAAALLTVCAGFDNRKPDADTAKAWALALDGLRYTDCRDAVIAHYSRSRDWIMPFDIVSEVKRVRARRIANDEVIEMPPSLDPDDTGAYVRVLVEGRRASADGQPLPMPRPLPDRDVSELGTLGREVPRRA